MLSVVWIAVGLLGLWLGAELALRSTVEVAERRGLSQGFLGVMVLAVGTDLPELLVAVAGGMRQLGGVEASGIVVGNAVGSALTQGSLVLGLAGLFGHLHLSSRTLRRDGTILLLAAGLLGLLASRGTVTRAEGGVLLVVYAMYARTLSVQERRRARECPEPWRLLRRQVLSIAIGLLVVLGCAHLVVEHALVLAAARGWNQTVIGLVLVGAGTSLPELALSVGAVAKGRVSLALGNVIGSNVFDLLVPVGVSALLHPLRVDPRVLSIDLPALALLTVLSLVFFVRRRGISRGEAMVLIAGYASYVALRVSIAG